MVDIIVTSESKEAAIGTVTVGNLSFPCTLGKNGKIANDEMMEGGWRTPIGEFPVRYLLWRADKFPKPETKIRAEEIKPDMGWCDAPEQPEYNKPVKLPYAHSHELMCREDYLYDYVIVIGQNDNPPVPYKGSAIFIHIARHEFTPTAGCVGLKQDDMLQLLKLIDENSKVIIR